MSPSPNEDFDPIINIEEGAPLTSASLVEDEPAEQQPAMAEAVESSPTAGRAVDDAREAPSTLNGTDDGPTLSTWMEAAAAGAGDMSSNTNNRDRAEAEAETDFFPTGRTTDTAPDPIPEHSFDEDVSEALSTLNSSDDGPSFVTWMDAAMGRVRDVPEADERAPDPEARGAGE